MTQSTHYRVCHLCEAACGLEMVVENNEVVTVKGDPKDPLSQGHICPKAVAIKDIHEDPDRIRQPIRRVGNEWHPISWNEAFDLVAEKLVATRQHYGNNSVAGFFGNPSVHNWGMLTHAPNLFKPLKTKSRYSATSVDQLPHQLICYWMYGHQVLVPVPDIDRTDFMIILGGNPLASNGSLWTVPGVRDRIKALKKRGGELVVVDPRRSETAEMASDHVFIRPGTDAWLLFAMINVLVDEGLVNTGRLTDHLQGLDQALQAIRPITAEVAAQHTGISAAQIRDLAVRLGRAERAVVYGRMGISVQAYGALCQWAVQLLNILTGNLDEPGGSMFSLPAVDLVMGPNSKPGHFGAWKTRVRGLPEFGGELPCSALAEEILTPGEGQIRALITAAGNPVLSTPNGRRLDEALESLDFMVSIDFYLNETTRHANVILPPTSPLEHDHYDLALMAFSVRNVAKYSPAVFEKPAGAYHDWEIFVALGERVAALLDQAPLPAFEPTQILDMGLQAGPYGAMQGSETSLNFEKVKANPHGVDLGSHEPRFPERLFHEDKKIHCAPDLLLKDLERLQRGTETADNGLLLIGRRHVRSNNSWMHNYQRLVKGKPRHQLFMHPQDAAPLRLKDGGRARISSRTGAVETEVLLTDEVMPGVVSLPHGWGHRRGGVKMAIAESLPGVSVNDLTDEALLDSLSGNAALNGVPVKVEALDV
ncbi:MAG: molybdopterin oxidoreductase family protein [Ketobacteraceae bacterium]|nr:molybdopterin oxidoreductase family protein [Ketobacteraceae bacterium]